MESLSHQYKNAQKGAFEKRNTEDGEELSDERKALEVVEVSVQVGVRLPGLTCCQRSNESLKVLKLPSFYS